MTLVKAIASGAVLCALILGLAVASDALLDRYIPRKPAVAAATVATDPAAAPIEGACVDASGAKRNWPWANAPTLWPSCKDNPPPLAPAAQK